MSLTTIIKFLFGLASLSTALLFATVFLAGFHHIRLSDTVLITYIVDLGITVCCCYIAIGKCVEAFTYEP